MLQYFCAQGFAYLSEVVESLWGRSQQSCSRVQSETHTSLDTADSGRCGCWVLVLLCLEAILATEGPEGASSQSSHNGVLSLHSPSVNSAVDNPLISVVQCSMESHPVGLCSLLRALTPNYRTLPTLHASLAFPLGFKSAHCFLQIYSCCSSPRLIPTLLQIIDCWCRRRGWGSLVSLVGSHQPCSPIPSD